MVRSEDTIIILMLALLYVVSAIFFHFVEGWSFLDSVYFTTMTISTVGYGDIVPMTPAGKVGSMLLILLGISLAFYVLTRLGAIREKKVDPHIKRRIEMLRNLAALQTGELGKGELKKIRKKMGNKGHLIKLGTR